MKRMKPKHLGRFTTKASAEIHILNEEVEVIGAPERKYRVIWKRADNGTTGVLFPGPLSHREAVTCKSKVTPQPWRQDMLEEIKS